MKKNTEFFEHLKRLNGREYLDAAGKALLGYRVICAFILKHCIKEFSEFTVDEISEKYIHGDPEIAFRVVHSGTGEDRTEVPEKVLQIKNEDADINEGTVKYDVIFEVIVPNGKGLIKMIINLEAQNVFNPGYPLVTRGIYYDARMISAQYGTEFTDSKYGDIKKVYSVWICINPDKSHKNTISRYYLKEENLFGTVKSPKEDYDKMEVIIVGLQCDAKEKSENELIEMLSVLFSKKQSAETKRKKLETNHGIKTTKEYDEVIENMCNISGYYTQDYDEAMQKLQDAVNRADKAETRANKAETRADEAEKTVQEKDKIIAELMAQLAEAKSK